MAWYSFNWFRGGGALSEKTGDQYAPPSNPIVENTRPSNPDSALQIAAVWSAIERRANLVASLPLFVYNRSEDGQKTLARDSSLYNLLHNSPNSRMTPLEFWRAMMMNHDLRGNAYARIDRNSRGEAIALWPMPADQVQSRVLEDGSMVYEYQLGGGMYIFQEKNVLHLKNLGNGTTGLAKLEFMRASMDENIKAQDTASRLFGTSGKATGVMMIDKVLSKEQRTAIQRTYGEMQQANTGRLFVLEADMKYQQLTMSPEDMQLLETRTFGVEELSRWFDVPPILLYHSNVTTWGTGIEQIIDGWYKLSMRPVLVSIEQAITKRVMTASDRARYTVEFSLDALLRGNIKDRYDVYKTAINYSLKTPNECRQLENDPPLEGGDVLMVQSNMITLEGAQNAANQANTIKPV
jgi:HK97 family phage portal protein